MKTRRATAASLLSVVLVLALADPAPGEPSADRTEPPTAAESGVGALTLETSPAASLFDRFVRPAAGDHARRDEPTRPLSTRRQDVYDRELSDSFPRHDPSRVRAGNGDGEGATASAHRARASVTVPPNTPLPVPAATTAAAWDFSVPVVAPVSPTASSHLNLMPAGSGTPSSAAPANLFAADMLAAPARTRLAGEAASAWLGATDNIGPVRFASDRRGDRHIDAVGNGSLTLTGERRTVREMGLSASVGPLPVADSSVAGAVYTWGYNNNGQLGDGTRTSRNAPVAVGSLSSGVTSVASGGSFSLAVQGGAVYAWGNNGAGQLGDGTTTRRLTPVAVPTLSSGVTSIAAGNTFGLAIQNGNVYAWGANPVGQLGVGDTDNRTTPTLITGLAGTTLIAAGEQHSLAVRGGAVYAWGYNSNGQLGVGDATDRSTPAAISSLASGVTGIAAGDLHSLAVRGGAVYAWGYNSNGQLGVGDTTDRNAPVAVLTLSTGVTSVAAGYVHSLALQNGNVFAWGYNGNGQLGNGTTNDSLIPIQIDAADLKNIVAIAAGAFSSYALSGDGSLWVWGDNQFGELGLGNNTQFNTPQHLLPPTGQYYEALDSDGTGNSVVAILGGTPPAVPEPATWLAGAVTAGCAAYAWGRRRLRR